MPSSCLVKRCYGIHLYYRARWSNTVLEHLASLTQWVCTKSWEKEMFLKGIQIRKQILSHNWRLDLVLYRKWGHSLVLPHKGLQVGQLSATCISFLRKPFSCRRVLLKHKVCNRLAHLGVSSLMKCLYNKHCVNLNLYHFSVLAI